MHLQLQPVMVWSKQLKMNWVADLSLAHFIFVDLNTSL